MDKKRLFTALIMAVVLCVGTYYALMTLLPYKPEELKLAANPSVDEIFGGSLNPAEAEPPPADTSAAPAATDDSALATGSTDGTAPVESAAMDLSSLSDETSAQSAPVVEEPAPAAQEAPAPVEQVPAPAAEPEVAAAEPVAEAAPAPKPKREVKRYTGSREAAAPEVANKAWWGAPSADSLGVAYVGSAAFKKAVVLIFNGSFDSADSVNQNVVVKSASGEVVSGSWAVSASNKRMVTLDVPQAGTYTVMVKSGVADSSGKTMADSVSGPVVVY